MPVEDYLPEWEGTWDASGHNAEIFFAALFTTGKLTRELYDHELSIIAAEKGEKYVPYSEPVTTLRVEVGEAIFETQRGYLATAFHEVLISMWEWIKKTFGEFFQSVWDWTVKKITDLWEAVKKTYQQLIEAAYNSITQIFTSHSPIKPEDAPLLATALFSLATASGIWAHTFASLTEAGHPYKNLGLQYAAGFAGELAGWSRLSAATTGVYFSSVLAKSMTYYVQKEHRPVIPGSGDLKTMAVKMDISIDEFRKAMAYQGYSDEWIDAYVRTMYREPVYRELLIMAESDVATDEWLINKLRRVGYDSSDAPLMLKAILKRFALTQRSSYYNNAFYMFREGYITLEEFSGVLDELELRPEAKALAIKAANLAYVCDYTKDMVTYYTDSYLKDLINDDELLVSLLSLGIVPERAWQYQKKAILRKTPKPTRPVIRAAEGELAKLQASYISLYTTQYRKGLIDDELLLESLLSIGMEPALADVTVALEAAKKWLPLPA